MKTSILLAATALAFFSASCRTYTTIDPLAFELDPSRMPTAPAAKSDCSKKVCKTACCCKKSNVTVNGTK